MNTVEIGRFIKNQLKQKGYTQENLADHLGISKQAVSQNLSGKSTFEISNLMLIAEFLDVSTDEILYAGSKRETLLEKFYNTSIDDMDLKDVPEQPDALNKTLLDYCIESNDINKFNHFYKNGLIIEPLAKNIEFVSFLIRNENIKLLKSRFRTPIKDEEGEVIRHNSEQLIIPMLSERSNTISFSRRVTPLYVNLESELKVFVDAVLNCDNEEVLELIPELRFNQKNRSNLTKLAMVALEQDKVHILDFYMKKNKLRTSNDLFNLAVQYNSMEVAKWLYDQADQFEVKTVENLLKISDREFIQARIGNMKLNKHQMSQGIIAAVKANDLMAVKSLINVVDEKSLMLALENANFDTGIEVAKALLEAGAEFSVINSYDSSNRIKMPSVTSAVKHLLSRLEDGKDK
jgi:transcriptional regulator with XRE-family HTH domain